MGTKCVVVSSAVKVLCASWFNTVLIDYYQLNFPVENDINMAEDEGLLTHIFSYLHVKDLWKKPALTCKQWNEIIDRPNFWRMMCLTHFPTSKTLVRKATTVPSSNNTTVNKYNRRKKNKEKTDQDWKHLFRCEIGNKKKREKESIQDTMSQQRYEIFCDNVGTENCAHDNEITEQWKSQFITTDGPFRSWRANILPTLKWKCVTCNEKVKMINDGRGKYYYGDSKYSIFSEY
jgi:hypothetical protein